MHDCKSDSFCLDSQFSIRLRNVFDTQSAHSVIQSKDKQDKVKNISLNNLCTFYNSNLNNPYKDKIKVRIQCMSDSNAFYFCMRDLII